MVRWRVLVQCGVQRVNNPRLIQPQFYFYIKEQGVYDMMALPFTLKSILRQKKNYGNSNISPCKNIIFKKNPLKENQKPFKIL
jgi:hypothetical protein